MSKENLCKENIVVVYFCEAEQLSDCKYFKKGTIAGCWWKAGNKCCSVNAIEDAQDEASGDAWRVAGARKKAPPY